MLFVAFWFFQPISKSQNNQDSICIKVVGPGTNKILKKDNGPLKIPFKMHYGKPLIS